MNPYTFDLRTHASWLKGQIHDASCAGPIVRHIVSVTVLMLCLGAVAVVYTYRDLHWRELSWQRADGLLKGQPCGNVNEVKDAASIQVPEATVSAWKAAAATNLTEFEASLAARMRPLKRNKNYWPHFPPVISCPPDRPLTRYGGCGDGSKLLCRLPTTLRDGHPCVIYSLGSNGDFKFEMAMLEATQCEVHTFDCTYKHGVSQHQGRHFYHTWCVGDPQQGPDFRTFAQITRDLNHTAVEVLKMDIEGHEYSVMEAFRANEALPTDLSVEIHANGPEVPISTVGLQFLHLAGLGYAAYSREVNPACSSSCCEFSFMRIR